MAEDAPGPVIDHIVLAAPSRADIDEQLTGLGLTAGSSRAVPGAGLSSGRGGRYPVARTAPPRRHHRRPGRPALRPDPAGSTGCASGHATGAGGVDRAVRDRGTAERRDFARRVPGRGDAAGTTEQRPLPARRLRCRVRPAVAAEVPPLVAATAPATGLGRRRRPGTERGPAGLGRLRSGGRTARMVRRRPAPDVTVEAGHAGPLRVRLHRAGTEPTPIGLPVATGAPS